MAMVTVDGGDGYWNPHPGDDPMAMVIDELIPRCRRLGLGRPPRRIAAMGISMGGYGALLLAEKYPRLIAAVAAISPAIWTSYPQARQANPGAYASAAAFAADDAVTHAAALGRRPVRVASGYADPFYPGVQALARALPAGAVMISARAVTTARSSPRRNRLRLPSWPVTSPADRIGSTAAVLHPGSIAGPPGFLGRALSTRHSDREVTRWRG